MSKGYTLRGVVVDSHKFQAVSTLDELEAFGLRRPTDLVKATKRSADERQLEMKELREVIQRTFDSPRVKRAEVYSAYIESVDCEKMPGGTPAITIWMSEVGQIREGELVIPYRMSGNKATGLIAVDGETQTEARFMLRERRPETGDTPIAVTIYHGISEPHARQILYDYNKNARPIGDRKLGAFNTTGPLAHMIEEALAVAKIEIAEINRNGAKPALRKGHRFSYVQLMYAATGMAMKTQALVADGARWFDELNAPTSHATVNGQTAEQLAKLLKSVEGNDEAKVAHGLIWQCAGIKDSPKHKLNWSAATEAYDRTRSGGRGGPRMPIAERLSAIYSVL